MSGPAKILSEQLKRAIEAGNFERAPELADAYGAAVRREIEEITTPEKRAAIAEEARSFLEERLHLARVMRAQIGVQLRSASGLASYQDVREPHKSWHIEG